MVNTLYLLFQHVSTCFNMFQHCWVGWLSGRNTTIFQQLPWGLQVISPPDVGQVGWQGKLGEIQGVHVLSKRRSDMNFRALGQSWKRICCFSQWWLNWTAFVGHGWTSSRKGLILRGYKWRQHQMTHSGHSVQLFDPNDFWFIDLNISWDNTFRWGKCRH